MHLYLHVRALVAQIGTFIGSFRDDEVDVFALDEKMFGCNSEAFQGSDSQTDTEVPVVLYVAWHFTFHALWSF